MVLTKCDICGVQTTLPLSKNEFGISSIYERMHVIATDYTIEHACEKCKNKIAVEIDKINKENENKKFKDIKVFIVNLKNELKDAK